MPASVRRNRARGYWVAHASRYGDEVLDLVSICHSGACRGQGQLLGPSKSRLESLMGFKRSRSLCTWSTWHPREAEKGAVRVRSNPATPTQMHHKTSRGTVHGDREPSTEITRDIWWYRDLCEASQTRIYVLLRFRRAIKRRKPPRWSPGAI